MSFGNPDKIIDLEFSVDNNINLEFRVGNNITPEFGAITETNLGKDYNKLANLPSINGTILMGNYNEIDPTVPKWAKNEKKPDYTPLEVGAVDRNNSMTFLDIKRLWDKCFN